MTEQKRPPVRLGTPERLYLGGKVLLDILKVLENIGWTNNISALQSVDLEIMMIEGNMMGAKFWHSTRWISHAPHKDTLSYKGYSLVRNCPTDGQEVISSADVKG